MKSLFEIAIPQISLDKKPRSGKPWVAVVFHHTGVPNEIPQDLKAWEKYALNVLGWLGKKDDVYVSAHFMVGRDGTIYMLVDPRTHIAFHAGKSSYFHPRERRLMTGWNEYSIGIELVGDGNLLPFTDDQYKAAAFIYRELKLEFPTITKRLGHEEVAPDRKVDPGKHFDWVYLEELIYQGV